MKIPRPIFFFGSAFLMDCALVNVYIALPIFALKQLAASPLELGVLGMGTSGAYALMAVAGGYVSDRTRRRPWVVAGAAAQVLGALALPLCRHPGQLILVSGAQSALLGFFWPPLMGLFSETTPPGRLSRALGRYNISWASGAALGALLSGLLYDRIGPAAPFWFGAALALGVLVLVMFGESGPVVPQPPHHPHERPRARLFLNQAWLLLLANFFVMNLLIYIFPKLAETPALAMSAEQISRLHGARMGAMLVMFALMGMTHRWHFRQYPIHVCFLLMLFMIGAVACITRPLAFTVPFLAFGASSGIAYGLSAYYSLMTPQGKGAAVGVHEALLALGSTLGPIFGGWIIWYSHRPAWPFWAAMAPLLGVWAICLWLQGKLRALPETKLLAGKQ